MSYDLMVFEASHAPHDKAAFMSWYEQQTQWGEDHDYGDPAVCSSALQQFYRELTETFPNMNGPEIEDEQIEEMEEAGTDYRLTDYSLGRSVIYAAFAWSGAEEAYQAMRTLAEKHGVGFFDVSGDGEIIWPS